LCEPGLLTVEDSIVKVRILPTAGDVSVTVASDVACMVRATPRVTVGLPTGRTPVGIYAELVRLHRSAALDLSGVTTFNLDEFLGLGPTQEGSFRLFMERHLFRRVNLQPERVHFLRGTAPDPAEECERYEAAIAAAGGIDLQILGLGENGHIGFNEPGESLASRTHRVRLRPETREANAALFGGRVDRVPEEALSMGMATILGARRIVLAATGSAKTDAVRGLISGLVTTQLPASFLQLHPDVEVVLDQAAAG
jgi:glucosamine-6-phosphate deaminase